MLNKYLSIYKIVCVSFFKMNIIVASNSSTIIHPENTLTSFTNELPSPLQLHKDAKICLESVFFDNIYTNIPSYIPFNIPHFIFYEKDENNKWIVNPNFKITLPHREIDYAYVINFIKQNVTMQKFLKDKTIAARLNKHKNVLYIRTDDPYCLAIQEDVANWLGFKDKSRAEIEEFENIKYYCLQSNFYYRFTHKQIKLNSARTLIVELEEIEPIISGNGFEKIIATLPYKPHTIEDNLTFNNTYNYEPKRRTFFNLNSPWISSFTARILNEDYSQINLSKGQPTFLKFRIENKMETTFSIRARSIDSLEIFNDNSCSHFKMKLPMHIDLNENWKIALTSIHIPNFINIAKYLSPDKYFIKIEKPEGFEKTLTFNETTIYTPHDLCYYINYVCNQSEINMKTSINNENMLYILIREKMTVTFSDDFALLLQQSTLAEELKLPQKIFTIDDPPKANTSVINFFSLIPHTLFLYSNIVEPSIIGNQYAPILKIVPHEDDSDSLMYHHEIKNLEYMNLKNTNFSILEFEIRDAAGNLIDFRQDYPTIVNLLFKKFENDNK